MTGTEPKKLAAHEPYVCVANPKMTMDQDLDHRDLHWHVSYACTADSPLLLSEPLDLIYYYFQYNALVTGVRSCV